jgi:hypothetical protein
MGSIETHRHLVLLADVPCYRERDAACPPTGHVMVPPSHLFGGEVVAMQCVCVCVCVRPGLSWASGCLGGRGASAASAPFFPLAGSSPLATEEPLPDRWPPDFEM